MGDWVWVGGGEEEAGSTNITSTSYFARHRAHSCQLLAPSTSRHSTLELRPSHREGSGTSPKRTRSKMPTHPNPSRQPFPPVSWRLLPTSGLEPLTTTLRVPFLRPTRLPLQSHVPFWLSAPGAFLTSSSPRLWVNFFAAIPRRPVAAKLRGLHSPRRSERKNHNSSLDSASQRGATVRTHKHLQCFIDRFALMLVLGHCQ